MTQGVERPSGAAPSEPRALSAGAFRALLDAFRNAHVTLERDADRAAAERRREQLKAAIEACNPDKTWRELLHRAREAAERGHHEYQLLLFPSDQCADSGRAVTQQNPDWPDTLPGEAAAIYCYWRDHLSAGGFHLVARVLEYSRAGIPGDVGLFLTWRDAHDWEAGDRDTADRDTADRKAADRKTTDRETAGQETAGQETGARPVQTPRGQMKAVLLLTAGGPLVILTSYASVLSPALIDKLRNKGVGKFVAFDVPLDTVKQRYANHFVVVAHDLHETDDLRVLDFDGRHVFQLFRFDELGEPTFHEGDRGGRSG